MEELMKVLLMIGLVVAFWDLVGWRVNKQPLFPNAGFRIVMYITLLLLVYMLSYGIAGMRTYAGNTYRLEWMIGYSFPIRFVT